MISSTILKSLVVIALGLVSFSAHGATTSEKLSLEIGYHHPERLTLQTVRGQKLEAYFLNRSVGQAKAKSVRITKNEYERRKKSLLSLHRKIQSGRRSASTCPQYVKIQVSKNTDTYCISQLSVEENKAIVRWWQTGR